MLPTITQEVKTDRPQSPSRLTSFRNPVFRKSLLAAALGFALLVCVALTIASSPSGGSNIVGRSGRQNSLLVLPSAASLHNRLAGNVHGNQWRAHLTHHNSSTEDIPKKLYVSVADKAKQPVGAKQAIGNCANLNPEYEVEVMGDAERTVIVEEHAPLLLPIFQKLKPTEKNDFWSYLMLYLFGGWYMDHDVQCLKSLEDFKASFNHTAKAIVGVEAVLPEGNRGAIGFCCPVQYCHWIMGSVPGHPLFGHVVDLMLDVQAIAEADPVSNAAVQIDNPIMTTGPGILTKAVEHFMAMHDTYPVDVALKEPQMVGDLGVMPRTAVAVGGYGTDRADPGLIFVKHMFAGTWKHGNSGSW